MDYDIADVLETMGFSYNDCDKTAVLEMAKKIREIILLSVVALQSKDKNFFERTGLLKDM